MFNKPFNLLTAPSGESMYPPVLTKADFVKRYALGEFGNKSPTWESLNEYLQSHYKGLVHIRNRIAGGVTVYNVPSNEVDIVLAETLTENPQYTKEDFYFSGMAPTQYTTIQGEVCQSINHYDLTYSLVVAPMRDALAQERKFATGIEAVCLIKFGMDSTSYEWLQTLLGRYPDHVVEFSCFSVAWGTVPHVNTLFWEVRKY